MDCLLSLASQACTDQKGAQIIQSECSFYHYLCDGFDDRVKYSYVLHAWFVIDAKGWGCGYRSLQSLCSWVVKYRQKCMNKASPSLPELSPSSLPEGLSHKEEQLTVPSIPELQSCLVEAGDKPSSFAGSREWIGCCEANIVLDHLYGVGKTILQPLPFT